MKQSGWKDNYQKKACRSACGIVCLILGLLLGACGLQPAGDPLLPGSLHTESPGQGTAQVPLQTPTQPSEPSGQKKISEQPEDEQATYLLVFWHAMADPDIVAFRTALREQLSLRGIALQEYDAGNNAVSQQTQIREAVNQHLSDAVLLIDPVGADRNLREACLRADFEAAGSSPVIIVGELADETAASDENASIIGSRPQTLCFFSDERTGGRIQGQMIRDYIRTAQQTDLDGDGETGVWILRAPGREAAAEESVCEAFGVEADLSASDGELVDIDGNRMRLHCPESLSVEDTVRAFDELLRDPGFPAEMIVCPDDEVASRLLVTLQSYGCNLGDGRCFTIPLFGFGGTTVCRANVAAGMMAGTVGLDWDALAENILDAAFEQDSAFLQTGDGTAAPFREIEWKVYRMFTNAS